MKNSWSIAKQSAHMSGFEVRMDERSGRCVFVESAVRTVPQF